MRAIAVTFACCILFPAMATAQARWEPSWPQYALGDALLTGSLASVAITAEIIGGPRKPRWDREILLDLPLRKAVGAQRTPFEHTAARISDATAVTLIAAPFLNAGLVGGVVHSDVTLATQLSLVSLESFAITFGLTNLTKVLVGRARPRVAECFANPEAPCEPRPPLSFFSGHSSTAFTGAGLICAAGIATPLFGDGVAAQVPCASALGVASVTAVLRILANKHHLSDVVVGTAVGLLSGWVWPNVRYFGR
jgi:membrane-associated phospholipid phosphatase